MSTINHLALGSVLLLATAGSLYAQAPAKAPAPAAAEKPAPPAPEKRASPHEKTVATLGGQKIEIEYGRPFKKGRDIFGALVPWKAVWRAGADEATTLTTPVDLTIGTLQVPKGTYTLFVMPGPKEWTLVVNKVAKQWGAYSYDQKQDLGRTAMKVSANPGPIEQFTIAFDSQGDKKGVLKMSWDKTSASVAISSH